MSGESGNGTIRSPAARSTVGCVLVLILVVTLAAGVALRSPPQLVVGKSVGSDFEVLAQETWASFIALFRARWSCFGDVRLEAAYSLDSRAGYDPGTATATVRVPGTAAMLQSALVHEWAHHVEFQCQAHEDLRPAFLAAQGLPPETSWRPDVPPAQLPASLWAEIPSEQYAEAVIELVLGRRPVPTNVRLTREAVRVVAEWARGEGCPACP